MNPSKIEWDLTNGPLSKLLELLDTQGQGAVQWVLLEISWMKGKDSFDPYFSFMCLSARNLVEIAPDMMNPRFLGANAPKGTVHHSLPNSHHLPGDSIRDLSSLLMLFFSLPKKRLNFCLLCLLK